MDRQTLANYGWIVIVALILAVMLALATPFGKYVMDGVSSIASGYINASNEAMSDANKDKLVAEWEDKWVTPKGSITFSDGTTLSWQEIKESKNATKYGYNLNAISDTIIGEEAFMDCDYIKTVIIPEGVLKIENSAFYMCSELETIEIASSVKIIGNGAFDQCLSLKNISIQNGLEILESQAFYGCGFSTIVLPSTLTKISNTTFGECGSLTNVQYQGTINQWNKIELEDCWWGDMPASEVKCKDGIVTIEKT